MISMPAKKTLHSYTFDYIGVRTVRAASFEEASKLAEEVPVDFTIALIETDDPDPNLNCNQRK